MEPSVQALGGAGAQQVIKRYWLAARPMFLPASVLPVLVGTSWGWLMAGRLDMWALLLATLATAAVHAGVNVMNDVYDERNGTDRLNHARQFPYTGGSRFIQNGILSIDQMFRWAVTLFVVAAALGFGLVVLYGSFVLVFGLIGISLGILYSMPPAQLASRGLGELAVAVGFGVLPVVGAAWLQFPGLDARIWWLALPMSAWVANILLINEFPDMEADARAGKRTLVVRLGPRRAAGLYNLISVGAAASLSAAVWSGVLSVWVLPVVLVLLIAGLQIGRQWRRRGSQPEIELRPLIERTLLLHTLGGIFLATAIWF